jgi:hypothetical protein
MLKRISIACVLAAFFLFCLFGIWAVQRISQQPPQIPGVDIHHQSENAVQRRNGPTDSPSGLKDQAGNHEHRSENASEITILWIKPGEWLIGGVTFLLWLSTQLLVREAKATSRRQLRAYVFLDPAKEFSFVRKPSTTATVEIEIHVKNLGATPAHDLIVESWMTIDIWPMPKEFTFIGPPGVGPVSKSVVPPGGLAHFHAGTAKPFTVAELAAIQNGDLCLYIYGSIKYKDAFNRPHWTNFCQGSTTLGKEGFRTAMAKCDRHNDTDNN